jgi:hypothetical protein
MKTQNERTKRIVFCMALITMAFSRAVGAPSDIAMVNCNSGKTIIAVLTKAHPGDTILVTGTCREKVSPSRRPFRNRRFPNVSTASCHEWTVP